MTSELQMFVKRPEEELLPLYKWVGKLKDWDTVLIVVPP